MGALEKLVEHVRSVSDGGSISGGSEEELVEGLSSLCSCAESAEGARALLALCVTLNFPAPAHARTHTPAHAHHPPHTATTWPLDVINPVVPLTVAW